MDAKMVSKIWVCLLMCAPSVSHSSFKTESHPSVLPTGGYRASANQHLYPPTKFVHPVLQLKNALRKKKKKLRRKAVLHFSHAQGHDA